jgi:hypothetical protein
VRPHNGRTDLQRARKQVGSNVSESYQNSGALINTAALAVDPVTVKYDAILLEPEPERCHVRDGDYGECTLPLGHGNGSKIHQEWRGAGEPRQLWAEWRSVLWEDECVCHVRPDRCPVHLARADLHNSERSSA